MRENFTYGSGRGVPRKGHPYRDLTTKVPLRVEEPNLELCFRSAVCYRVNVLLAPGVDVGRITQI